jgi:hypothetical protein
MGIVPLLVAGEFGNMSMSSVKFHHLNFAFIADKSYGCHVAKFNCGERLSRIKTDSVVRLLESRI